MIFDKIKTTISAFPGQCMVNLTYGNERDSNLEERTLDTLQKAGITTDPFYRSFQDESTISAALSRNGSICFRLEGSSYRNAQGEQSDGCGISFYTTTKDLVKAGLGQLKRDGLKLNKSTPILNYEIDDTYDKEQMRGVA